VSKPEFLSTTTSHACKIGPFQFRRLRNGDIYKGRYARSKKCGDGCYSFMNGDVYEGEFQDDHMQGHGVYIFAGQGRYEGGWQTARYSGHGAETFAKGSTYAGALLLQIRLRSFWLHYLIMPLSTRFLCFLVLHVGTVSLTVGYQLAHPASADHGDQTLVARLKSVVIACRRVRWGKPIWIRRVPLLQWRLL
jgi:hypothetical protein